MNNPMPSSLFPSHPMATRASFHLRVAATLALLSAFVGHAGSHRPSDKHSKGPGASLQAPLAKSVQVKRGLRGGTSAEPIRCPYCVLDGANFSGQDLTDANLTGASLVGANFTGSIVSGASFIGANLTDANFSKSKILASSSGVTDFSRSIVSGTDFRGAVVDRADFQYTDFGSAKFDTPFRDKIHRSPTLRSLNDTSMWSCPTKATRAYSKIVYVSASGRDDANCGNTTATSCASIHTGIARCTGPSCQVQVYWGQYSPDSTIVVPNGVDLTGGCFADPNIDTSYFSVIYSPTKIRGTTLSYVGGVDTALLSSFQIVGSEIKDSSGNASQAVTASNTRSIVMRNLTIAAGTGAHGTAGMTGTIGFKGGDASGATGGVEACPNTAGGNGSVTEEVSVDLSGFRFTCKPSCSNNSCYGYYGSTGQTGQWASGGKWGDGHCVECPVSRGSNGNSGGVGANGSCGNPGGKASDAKGRFAGLNWQGKPGGDGSNGLNAGGGGGGGAGGYKAGACFWVKTQVSGNQGGGGGAGGCGALSAKGGGQGGASFAVVLLNSSIKLMNSRLLGGRSGDGGEGGAGRSGGTAGAGAAGRTNLGGGYGGHGGNGGIGGSSGPGAGGNSGPVALIALLGNSNTDYTGSSLMPGMAGVPGSGGAGAKTTNNCATANAESGIQGQVVNTIKY